MNFAERDELRRRLRLLGTIAECRALTPSELRAAALLCVALRLRVPTDGRDLIRILSEPADGPMPVPEPESAGTRPRTL